jgi:hypothetical protein
MVAHLPSVEDEQENSMKSVTPLAGLVLVFARVSMTASPPRQVMQL